MGAQQVLDALLGSTGQQRSAWLERQNENARYYLGPAYEPIAGAGKLLGMLSPGADMLDMVKSGGELMNAKSPMGALQAGAGLGAATLGMAIPGTAKGVGEGVQEATKGIRAYHGSPHDFDAFSMDKIGTGEGAQAYGHGLYFADNEGVAKSYRDSLAGTWSIDGKPLLKNNQRVGTTGDAEVDDLLISYDGDIDAAIKEIDDGIAHAPTSNGMPDRDRMWSEFRQKMEGRKALLESLRGRFSKDEGGHMYEVNINASPDDFLDWDKPLSEQSEKVRGALVAQHPVLEKVNPQNVSGQDAYRGIAGRSGLGGSDPNAAGGSASTALRDAGIPGIRYLDQGSRTAGEGTSNYVVFDDKLISILRKYGMAGLALPGLGAAAMGSAYGTGEQQ